MKLVTIALFFIAFALSCTRRRWRRRENRKVKRIEPAPGLGIRECDRNDWRAWLLRKEM